ncbi:MAG: hypothetical protein OEV79_05110 [candidate division WOR-3 bacterium]|nr:hypothetical protein [candidate division WOR-3 bacterium]
MDKVLVVVFDTHTTEDSIVLCIKMMQHFKPLIQIISPVDRHAVTRVASNEGAKEAEVRERMLHETYTNLYHLEDLFSKHGLQVNIAAKEMRLPEELLTEIRKMNPGMLVVVGKIDPVVLETLYGSFHVPILLLAPED